MSARRGIRTALLVSAALLLSGVAVATAPDNDTIVGEIATTAAIGDEARTRQFTATVHGVSRAEAIDVSYGEGAFDLYLTELPTEGVWVVIDLEITSRYRSLLLEYSELRIGGVSYRASTLLPDPTVMSHRFGPGIAVRGPLVFEIPRNIAESDAGARAVIVIKAELTPQVEGVTHHPVDLGSIPDDRVAKLDEATIGRAS